MKQFYAASLATCVKSGFFLTALLLVPIFVYSQTSATIFAGISAIAVGAFMINNGLSRAGLDTVGAQLSHLAPMARIFILVLALGISFLTYAAMSVAGLNAVTDYDLARLAFALIAASFFPTVFYLISAPFTK